MQRTLFFADCSLLFVLNLTKFCWEFLPEPLIGIFNRVLTDVKTKAEMKMEICIRACNLLLSIVRFPEGDPAIR